VSRVVAAASDRGLVQSYFAGLTPPFALQSGQGYLLSVPMARTVSLPVAPASTIPAGLTFMAVNAQGYNENRPETILQGYAWLEPEDLRACLTYAYKLVAHERFEPAVEAS
jgi:hypothetical protein